MKKRKRRRLTIGERTARLVFPCVNVTGSITVCVPYRAVYAQAREGGELIVMGQIPAVSPHAANPKTTSVAEAEVLLPIVRRRLSDYIDRAIAKERGRTR